MTSWNVNIFRATGPLCGISPVPTQKPVVRSFGVSFDLRLDKRLSKQSWGWWFETLSFSLWRHPNEVQLLQDFDLLGFSVTIVPQSKSKSKSKKILFIVGTL